MDRQRLSRLKRGGQVLAPSIFTMGNAASGFACILAAHIGDYTVAGMAILLGLAFDMLDGRVARLVHGESAFGVEFDSLADFLTFGVAPAFMMYALFLKDYGIPGVIVSFIYTLCGGMRLARFNAVAHAGEGSKTHFTGLPIPAAAGFLASLVLLYTIVEQERPIHELRFLMDWVPRIASIGPFIMLVLGFLMISNIPYAAFKQTNLLDRKNYRVAVAVTIALALLYFYPQNAIFLIFLFYVISGFTGMIMGPPADGKKS